MSTIWQPRDISQICSETQSNLTQCSPAGFMYLALIVRLFGDVNYTVNEDTERSKENEENKFSSGKDKDEAKERYEYDFIIVGAGSAGCVLANRLSEEEQWRILLIEAGSEEPDITMVPSLYKALKGSSLDWNYSTQPEEMSCRSMKGHTCDFTR